MINPEDIALYLNIAFISTLLIGLLIGLLKGFRRSLYTFIVTLIFVGIFFLTVNQAVNFLYTLELNFLGGALANVDAVLSNVTSVEEAVHIYLPTVLPDQLDLSLSNPDFWSFVDSLGMFILKVVYTILFFTVIQFLYRFIFFIIGIFIFRKGRAKNKKGKRSRPLGALFGTLTAAVNLILMIVVLSGIISIGDSLSAIQTDQLSNSLVLEPSMRPNITQLSQSTKGLGRLSYQPLAEEQQSLDEALSTLRGIVEAYNENIVIQAIDTLKVEDEQTGEEKNVPILLFDEVLSINYNEQTIGLREDLRTFSQLANIYFTSDFYNTSDLSDITSGEITDLFTTLAYSKLLTNLIPVGIEVGIDYADIDLVLDKELLYETIVWEDEIDQLGAVVSTGFTILEAANAFDENVDYKTVALNGGEVKLLFDELSDSKLVEYGAFIAVGELLTSADSMIQSVITVPDNIDWSDEFAAFGLIADEVLKNGLTIGDLDNEDQQQLLLLFTDIDLTVLLESKLATRALINILSGESELTFDIEFLVIPDLTDDEWYDELSGEGELFNVLTSLSILVNSASAIDLDDPQISDLASLTPEEIDSMFNSDILRASISELLLTLPTGSFDLIIPDAVLDEDNYIIKAEAVAMLSALTMLAEEIPCDVGDDSCAELGVDMDKVTNLDSDNISVLFDSEVLFSSVSYLLLTFDELVVPNDILVEILVEEQAVSIISRQELINTFSAITALGITDFENIQVDESLLLNLSVDPILQANVLDTDKTDALFESRILHATISFFLIDMTTVEPPETSPVIVPYFAAKNYEGTTSNIVRYEEAGVTFISESELTNILKAILILDIDDFASFSSIDFTTISDNLDVLLDSAILHATVSDQIIQLKDDETLTIPYQDVDGVDVIFTIGNDISDQTTYVSEDELLSVLDALSILNITSTEDISNLSIETIDLDEIINNDDEILSSAIIHATLSSQIISQAETTTLIIPMRDLNANEDLVRLNIGPDGEEVEFISKREIKATLNALKVLDMTNLDAITIDTSILSKLSVDPITDPTTLSTVKSDALLASKIVHATISKVLIDTAVPDAITGEQTLLVPYVAYEDYVSTGNSLVRYTTQDDDVYIINEELNDIFKVVLLLDIEDFEEVSSLDLSLITSHRNSLFNSAILHATISNILLDYTDDGSLIIPTYDLDNETIIRVLGDALLSQDTTYVIKEELISTLDALEIFEITDFDSVNVDASIIKKLAIDPLAVNLVLDEDKAETVLSSKIIHATISKVILDAATPDEITGDSDINVPYIAETNYNNDSYAYYTDDVRFLTTDDSDEYIVEAELVELFSFVLALNLDDFTNIDGLSLSDILPHKLTIFNSAIIQATISDIILDLDDDGTLVVPTYNLSNEEVVVTKGDALLDTDTTYVTQIELINILTALGVLGIDDFTNVDVDISILNELAIDPEAAVLVLDEDKAEEVLASKIIHATITKVILDAGEPDQLTGESDIVVPYVAETNYNSVTYSYTDDDVRFYTTNDTDEYLVEAELMELFRFVLNLGLTDLTNIDGLLLSDILPYKDTMFKSAIIQATISDIILDFDLDGTLVVPYMDLLNLDVRVTKGDAILNQDIEYVREAELIQTLIALDTLDIQDFTNVDVDISILNELAIDPEAAVLVLDEDKAEEVLGSKIIHATITKVILDAGEPDQFTGESDIVVPYVAETNYNSVTYSYTDDDVRFYTTNDTDEYLVEAELTELFRFVLNLGLTDLTNIDGLLLSDILPHIDTMFKSAIIQATISDIILDFDLDGTLVVPYMDLLNLDVRVTKGDAILNQDIEYVREAELKQTLIALDTLDIQDFTNVTVDVAILKKLAVDPLAADLVLDDNKSEEVLASKIIHATITKVIMDATEVDAQTGESDLLVPYYAEINYSNATYNYYDNDVRFYTTNDTDEYIVEAELTELFRFVLALDLTDFENMDGLLLSDILPHKDTIFDSAIIQAKISDLIFDFGDDGSLVVPFYNLSNEDIRVTKGLLEEQTNYIAETELINTLVALDVLGIDDLSNVVVDVSILSNLAIDPLAAEKELDAAKSESVLASKIIHATISNVIFDAAEPDNLGNQSIIVPKVAEVAYNNVTYNYNDDDVTFSTTANTDDYIVQAELTELFKIILILDVQDFGIFNDEDGTLFSKLLPNRDVLFDSAIIQATVSDQILELEDTGNLVVPNKDLDENLIVINKAENGLVTLVAKAELINTLAALEVLEITSFNSINIDAGILLKLEDEDTPDTVDQDKFSTLLSSKIVHATISDMIIEAGEGVGASLVVPFNAPENYVASGTDAVRLSSTTADEYIVQAELSELFRIIIILEVDDFAIFDDSTGSLFTTIFPHKNSIFDSAVIQATISDQIFDIESSGSLVVPSLDDTNTVQIIVEAGDALLSQNVSFIIKDELISMLTALDRLGLSNFNDIDIDASVLLNLGDGGTPQHVDPAKSAEVLGSKIVHASITDMLLEAGQDGSATLVIPYLAAENYVATGDNDVRFVSNDADIYIIDAEMNQLFDALLVLNISDFDTVSTLSLDDIITNKVTLMASAILHATISKQVIDLDTGVGSNVIVPEYDELGASIIFEDTTDELYTVTYLTKTELYAFFDAVDLLDGTNKIDDFNGSVNLNLFFKSANPGSYQSNQATLLASAVLQATISDKISGLNGNQLLVPSYSIGEVAVEVTHDTDYFVYENEIKALIDVLDLVGATNIEDFSGTFTVGSFDEASEQDTLLASAIMHRTLSNQLLTNNGIVVPKLSLESDNVTNNDVHVQTTNGSEDYIVGQEIRDLIAVISILSAGDDSSSLNSINSTFNLSTFDSNHPANQAALLASAIMHASFSNELIGLNDDVLFIPTYTQEGEVFSHQIKFLDIDLDGSDYIAQAEVVDIIDAFVALGVGDLSEFDNSSSLDAGEFFADIETYLESASFHATISNKLFNATGTLIIPTRDINDTYDVTIVQADVTYLEHDETVNLVAALNELGLDDFNANITGGTITNLTGPQLDTILLSGSMHLTFDDIIQDNNNLSIPDLAIDDLFALTDILIKDEIKNFILGSSAFITATGSGATVSNITFTLNDIQALDVNTRSTMLNSMIVRNMLTPDLEAAKAAIFQSFANSDYMNDDPSTFLKKAAIQTFLGDPVD